MNDHMRSHFKKVLDKMEKLENQIFKHSGYNEKTRTLRMLTELIKEQFGNENTRRTTR